jgi:hypothetical protein
MMTDYARQRASADARPLILIGLALAIQASLLYWAGQPQICTCGVVRLWVGDVLSAETSQQITDWYTPSHVIHGILFYAALRLLFPRLPLLVALTMALGVEMTWELAENSPTVIERYRQQALAQGYHGDSILNSLCDTLSMAAGFFLARVLPVRLTVTLVVVAELFTGLMVRDNLTLNVVQLLAPSSTISAWQAEGGWASAPAVRPSGANVSHPVGNKP